MKVNGIKSSLSSFSGRRQRACVELALACLASTAQAQSKPPAPADHGNVQQLMQQVGDLRKEILEIRKELEALQTKLSVDEYLLRIKQDKSEEINLDLTQKAYQRLDTDNGFFLVSVEETVPYLNGYKIHLTIGNPSYATYMNYKLKVRYSKPYDWGKYTQASYDEWNKGILEKEISYPESLQPGTWNSVDVVLAPANADQLGYLTLSMAASTVSLHTH
ncbi:MAG TPA: hypothetical protein VGZ91_08495 [Candidatus Sulfotelmatobacter sp.]|jgi:hypothetical protein|nr:hypothetical protein [Candidatus Sulfotelmatobacter sp.]